MRNDVHKASGFQILCRLIGDLYLAVPRHDVKEFVHGFVHVVIHSLLRQEGRERAARKVGNDKRIHHLFLGNGTPLRVPVGRRDGREVTDLEHGRVHAAGLPPGSLWNSRKDESNETTHEKGNDDQWVILWPIFGSHSVFGSGLSAMVAVAASGGGRILVEQVRGKRKT